ncbi:MAG: superoxide dismutase [Bacillota bacterium]
MNIIAKKYDFSKVKGISDKQLNLHYQLYLNYINSFNKIMEILSTDNQNNFEFRGLQESKSYSINGIILHELYFENLGISNKNDINNKLFRLIEITFGSFENWYSNFIKVALNSRGWAVLAYNYRNQRLHNIMQDSHNTYLFWNSKPLLVLDIYEHAYMIDFDINKSKYLNIFLNNIDWKIVNKRFSKIFTYY